jgi:signal peptidase I
MRNPEAPSQDGASSRPGGRRVVRGRARARADLRGPRGVGGPRGMWRVTVADGSMTPAVLPGDWLLVDPTVRRWPRRGSIVVFREPFTDLLAIKRVAARPGDWIPFADGWLQLGDDEAWLIGDASDADLSASGHGAANDSRRYGPVPVDALVGRGWFRYGPARRIGRLAPPPRDLLERSRSGSIRVPSQIGMPGVDPRGSREPG